MSESRPAYAAIIAPSDAEIALLSYGRRVHCVTVVDFDSLTIWVDNRPLSLRHALPQMLEPTEAELNLIARGRTLGKMAVVDFDSMTIWPTTRAEYLNGKRSRFSLISLPFAMDA